MNQSVGAKIIGGIMATFGFAAFLTAGAGPAQASDQLNFSTLAASTPAVASVDAAETAPRGCEVTYSRWGRFETLGLEGAYFGRGHWTVHTRFGPPEHYSSWSLSETHRVPRWRGDITYITGGTGFGRDCRSYRPYDHDHGHGPDWPVR